MASSEAATSDSGTEQLETTGEDAFNEFYTEVRLLFYQIIKWLGFIYGKNKLMKMRH